VRCATQDGGASSGYDPALLEGASAASEAVAQLRLSAAAKLRAASAKQLAAGAEAGRLAEVEARIGDMEAAVSGSRGVIRPADLATQMIAVARSKQEVLAARGALAALEQAAEGERAAAAAAVREADKVGLWGAALGAGAREECKEVGGRCGAVCWGGGGIGWHAQEESPCCRPCADKGHVGAAQGCGGCSFPAGEGRTASCMLVWTGS
jgi:hypothetical protein